MNNLVFGSHSRAFRLGILHAALAAVCLVGAGNASAEKLTMAESIRIALENNPSMHIARTNERKADAMVKQALSAGMPTLTIDGTYQRADQIPTIDFGGQTMPVGALDSRSGNLTLAQPLDVFGIVKLAKKAASSGKAGYIYATSTQVNDTTLDVKTAYYNVLRAQAGQKVTESTIETLDAHLKDTQANYNAGNLPKFDVLRAETELANARQGLISSKNGVELAKAAFNNVLGRALDTPVDLEDAHAQPPINIELAACTDCAQRSRPEVQQAARIIDMNDQIAKATKKSGMPKFGFRWAMNKNFDTSVFSPQSSSWKAYLTASMPLFDGGATKAATARAESDTKISQSARDQVVLGVALDTQQAYLEMKAGTEKIAASEKALEQARESMRLANLRYAGGVSTQVEVLDARSALTTAETNHVNAMYDYDIAVAKLEKAVGGQKTFIALLGAQPVALNAQAPK